MEHVAIRTSGWLRADLATEPVDVTMHFDPSDPFAVRVRVLRDEGEFAWVFARDLLADGVRSMIPLGEGDVQVQATSVLAEITRTDELGEQLLLRLPWWDVREFVRLSLEQVPRGSEICDVDAWLFLLTGAEPA